MIVPCGSRARARTGPSRRARLPARRPARARRRCAGAPRRSSRSPRRSGSGRRRPGRKRPRVGVARVAAEDVVGEAATLAHLMKRRDDMPPPRTVGRSWRTYRSGARAGSSACRRRCAPGRTASCGSAPRSPFVGSTAASAAPVSRRRCRRERLEALEHAVADPSAEPDDGALRPVPAVEVAEERVAGRAADGLLGADDVPAERLVAVEVPLPDVADVRAACRRTC